MTICSRYVVSLFTMIVMVVVGAVVSPTRAAEGPGQPIDVLLKNLQADDALVRLQAAKALGEKAEQAEIAIPALEKALGDADEDVRLVAKRSLDRIRIAGNTELSRLITSLQDPDTLVRLRSAKALGDMGGEGTPALPALEKACQDDDEDVRRVAQHAMDKIKSSGNPEVHRLMGQLKDPDSLVRMAAAKQLGALGKAAHPAIAALKIALEDPDEVVRIVVKNALKKLEKSGAAVLEPGENNLTDAVEKIKLTELKHIFSPPEVTSGFLRKSGSMRFVVTLKNTAKQAVKVGLLRARWLEGTEEIHNEDVAGPILAMLPGQMCTHTFALKWDRDSVWDRRNNVTVEVAMASPIDLTKAEQLKLEAMAKELQAINVLSPKPIYNFGVHMGEQFTLNNTSGKICKGAVILLMGYDDIGDWVHALLYYAPIVPKGYTHIKTDASKSVPGKRRMVKLASYQCAMKDMHVRTYKAKTLAHGLAEEEL